MEEVNVSASTVSSLQSAFNLATFTHSQIGEQEKGNFEASSSYNDIADSQGHPDVQG